MRKRPRLLVTGASGFLGACLVQEARKRGFAVTGVCRSLPGKGWGIQADLGREGEAGRILEEARPDLVVHAAAMSRIPECEKDPEEAFRVNRDGTRALAEAAARAGVLFLFVSTDHVFDGKKAPYRPGDPPSPVSVYGRSKAEGEEAVRNTGGTWQVVRVSLLYGKSPGRGNPGASEGLLALLARGGRPRLFTDEFRTPLEVGEASRCLLDLLQAPPGRTWHLGGPERVSRYSFGLLLARAAGFDPALLERGSRLDRPEFASRPRDLSLDSRETHPFLDAPPSPPAAALEALYRGGTTP